MDPRAGCEPSRLRTHRALLLVSIFWLPPVILFKLAVLLVRCPQRVLHVWDTVGLCDVDSSDSSHKEASHGAVVEEHIADKYTEKCPYEGHGVGGTRIGGSGASARLSSCGGHLRSGGRWKYSSGLVYLTSALKKT